MVGPESGLCGGLAFVGRLFIVKNITVVILPGGLCREVAFVGRSFIVKNITVGKLPGGLCSEVAITGRWPLMQVRLCIHVVC